MSRFGVNGYRCDWCGKIANNQDGEYQRPVTNAAGVNLAGYIHSPDWDKEGPRDICQECAENLCPYCGGKEIVHTHPGVPGPLGWGGRCKTCGRSWSLYRQANEEYL